MFHPPTLHPNPTLHLPNPTHISFPAQPTTPPFAPPSSPASPSHPSPSPPPTHLTLPFLTALHTQPPIHHPLREPRPATTAPPAPRTSSSSRGVCLVRWWGVGKVGAAGATAWRWPSCSRTCCGGLGFEVYTAGAAGAAEGGGGCRGGSILGGYVLRGSGFFVVFSFFFSFLFLFTLFSVVCTLCRVRFLV